MAINPELITTIRVDQLPDETLNLTNLFPHTVGTELKSATIQELVDLVATSIGVSGGVGYLPISVTDGQQLPNVPESPGFFLCGAGTFLNINGFPNIICTDELNAVMSLTDHWQLAVGIPIVAEVGVQTVTGSAVDNTDPLNPVINSTGGGGTQTLSDTLDNGNETGGSNIELSNGDAILLDNGANLKKGTTDAGLGGSKGIALRCAVDYELKWEAGRLYVMGGDGFTIREVSHNFTTTPTVNDDDDKGFVIDSRWILDNGNVYVCNDATTGAAVWELQDLGTIPTLQQVTDEGNETTIPLIVKQTENERTITLQSNGLGFADIVNEGTTNLVFESSSIPNQQVFIKNESGTLALLSDITTPTLQEVTDEGSETTNTITVGSLTNNFSQIGNNSVSTQDVTEGTYAYIDSLGFLGLGKGNVDGEDPIECSLYIRNVTEQIGLEFPDKPAGIYTIATTDDIPSGGSGIPHATASGTDTYTATITGIAAYNDADAFLIRFTNGNTSSATLNINSLGAKTLYRNNDGALIGGDIINGGEMLCIYNTSLNGFQLIGTAPNSLFAYVTNDDSVTLTKGMPVYAFSGTGDRMTVKRANNTTDSTSAQTVGLVLSTSIAANQKGLIMMQGLLDGLSILPTSTFADGDAVYLGATAGTITNVKPYAPNHLVYLGVVTTASNGSAGRMYVRVQNGYELSEIHDIDLITNAPTNNQALVYESSTDLWKNKTIIEDSITNGVTDKAPSQNSVFDALALKQNALGFTPYKFIQTNTTAHTGTVAETIVATATIAGGTFNSTDVMKVIYGANKSAAISSTLRIKINTSNTLTGAVTLAGTLTTSANALILKRNFMLNGGNLYGVQFSLTNTITDEATVLTNVYNNTPYNTANTLYLLFTVQITNIADSVTPNLFNITN
jgi:hypothetical protein